MSGEEPGQQVAIGRNIGRQLKWMVGGGSRSEVAEPAAAAAAMRQNPHGLCPLRQRIVAALVVGLSVWALKPTATSSSRPVSRLLLTPSPTAPLVSGGGTDVTISPDGTRIVYLGDAPQGGRALYVRELGGLEPVAIAGEPRCLVISRMPIRLSRGTACPSCSGLRARAS